MSTAAGLPEQRLMNRLRTGDSDAYAILYQRCYPVVERYVLRNNGSADEARDLFQDTLLVVLTALAKPDFVLTCSIQTYTVAISKNLWFKRLRETSRWEDLETVAGNDRIAVPAEQPDELTTYERIRAILSKLTTRCQDLLTAIFVLEKTIKAVVRDNGYANVHTAQNQKYKCLEQARKETGKVPAQPAGKAGNRSTSAK